ncbi:MAG TPA: hypothetical protein VF932_12920, partial [Anaerolineae bacterium]
MKTKIAVGDCAYETPLKKLKQEAEQALLRGPFSVTDKTFIPPSGDRHDYVSLARYFWPDPNAPN